MSSNTNNDIATPASPWNLPAGISSTHITIRNNTVKSHFLSAGNPSDPLILLLHGFPELSYSWRDVIMPLSSSNSPGGTGYYVVAPDHRGFGLSSLLTRSDPSSQISYDEDLNDYRQEELVEDVVALVHALGKTKVHLLIGHDFGSTIAGNCAIIHPELAERLVLMSAPFTGPVPQTDEGVAQGRAFMEMVQRGLAALDPPRKHYMVYFSGPEANRDMLTGGGEKAGSGEGEYSFRDFIRAYWHVKSADWELQPDPHSIPMPSPGSPDAKNGNPLEALAEIPEYYIMRSELTMPQTVLPHLPRTIKSANEDEEHWMSESALAVYVDTYRRTGFQGGLNLYRAMISPLDPLPNAKPELMKRKIEVPTMFIAGKKDWGTWQFPGAVERMKALCVRMREAGRGEEGVVLVECAGHWVQQERPKVVVRLLAEFAMKGV
ncbi:alpha/beta-hydrolase [Stereum hirsutum FP-91666 SS1]|uniref:alpha/beta-hydrolase n=1 Tax=Stereum hirsutum (strain FP-91666) TaxID=721885 RepID=UPI000440E4C1|nr:alpha/beta-hydrolase [Stereum hirsutum FP-91666 SS1]EIM88817.1 alpha/beta-hydrolase [Stereum hirsutum FP-91666 SS1]